MSRFEKASDYGGEDDEESFGDWFGRQNKQTQVDVLGSRRAADFAAGKFNVESFVERPGSELSLEELSVREAAAFEAAAAKWALEQEAEAALEAAD